MTTATTISKHFSIAVNQGASDSKKYVWYDWYQRDLIKLQRNYINVNFYHFIARQTASFLTDLIWLTKMFASIIMFASCKILSNIKYNITKK